MQSWVAPTKLMYQGDKGYNQPFILTNAWQEYDVTADNLAFSARKPDGQVIEIENEPTRFVQKEGVWYFKLPDELTQAVGEVSCFFYVKDDTGIVASTTKFAYYVEAKFTESEISFSYVSLLEKLAKVFREYTDDAKNQVNELTTVTNDYKQKLLELLDKLQKQTDDWLSAKKAEIDADIKIRTDKIDALNKEYVDKYNELVNSWNAMISEQADQYTEDKSDRDSKFKTEQSARATDFNDQKEAIASEFEGFKEQYKTDRATRESDYQSQKVAIQNTADKQHDDIDKKFQELVQQYQSDKNARDTDYQRQLATILATIAQQRDQAISDAKADLQSQKETLQSDINEFKSNLKSQVNSLSSQLAKTQTDADELNKILKAIKEQIDTVQSEITSVDFNSYLTKVDATNLYYDKETINQKIDQAGKVKTVDGKEPDAKGNIDIDHYTKLEVDQKIDQAGKVQSVNGQTGDVNLDLGVTSVNGQKGSITGIATLNDIKVQSVNKQIGDVNLTYDDLPKLKVKANIDNVAFGYQSTVNNIPLPDNRPETVEIPLVKDDSGDYVLDLTQMNSQSLFNMFLPMLQKILETKIKGKYMSGPEFKDYEVRANLINDELIFEIPDGGFYSQILKMQDDIRTLKQSYGMMN